MAARYYGETQAEGLMVTLGKRGSIQFFPPVEGPPGRLLTAYLPAFSQRAVDTVGAGDVFLATAALATVAGVDPASAQYLAK